MWVCAGIQRLIRHMDQGQTMHIRAVQCRDICKMLTILNIKIEPASQWLRDMASKQHAHASSANGTKLSINSDTCAHTTRACSTSGVELANHVIYTTRNQNTMCLQPLLPPTSTLLPSPVTTKPLGSLEK